MGAVTIEWVEQARDHHGWYDVQLVDELPFCCRSCLDGWLAAHPGALKPQLNHFTDGRPTGRRTIGRAGAPLTETGQDIWCAACGVLVQLGVDEPPCPTDTCPPVVFNRFLDEAGERCPDCGRWRQLPAGFLHSA